eukprot:gene36539-8377_t
MPSAGQLADGLRLLASAARDLRLGGEDAAAAAAAAELRRIGAGEGAEEGGGYRWGAEFGSLVDSLAVSAESAGA